MLKWFDEKGKNDDVVLATRVRLSRNLNKYPFSTKMSDGDAKELVEEMIKICSEEKMLPGNTCSCNLTEMNENNRIALVERHILSPVMVEKKQSMGLLINEQETAELMINEEDHLRIQTLSGGMNIADAYVRADKIDDRISEKFDIAYDEKYGYLTTCPTNVGTGLRISYLLFLPALGLTGKINTLISEISKYGVSLRGAYEGGIERQSAFFQISNQKTLGCSEQEIIENLNTIACQIVKQERVSREYLFTHNYNAVEDQIYRSYGVLKYTKQIDSKQAVALLAQVMFGTKTGIVKLEEGENLYEMIMNIQPYAIQAKAGKSLGSMTRDRLRAEYVNKNLPQIAVNK